MLSLRLPPYTSGPAGTEFILPNTVSCLTTAMPDNAEVASRLCDLYRFFVSIGYLSEDQVRWPPHSSEDLDIDDCRAKGYSDSAITLLQALPWPKNHFPDFVISLIRRSKAADYSDDEEVEGGRHPIQPDWDRDEEFLTLLPGHMITLSFGEWDEGLSVVLDADDGKCCPPDS